MNELDNKVSSLFDSLTDRRGPELSQQEARLLELMADGWSEQEVAHELSVSVELVQTRVEGVVAKLRARSTLHALAIAFRRCLLPVERRHGTR
jgi:DNA-binding NarL/FixJ family response regulator